MNLKLSLKQFEVPVFSSLSVPLFKKNSFKFQVMAESAVRGEIDFLWLYIFTRVQPNFKKIKLTNQKRTKRKNVLTFSTFHDSYLIFSVFRKLKWSEMHLKDPADISTWPVTEIGSNYTRLARCEQTRETQNMINLNSGLGFFLEDIIIFSNFFYKNNPSFLKFMQKIYI